MIYAAWRLSRAATLTLASTASASSLLRCAGYHGSIADLVAAGQELFSAHCCADGSPLDVLLQASGQVKRSFCQTLWRRKQLGTIKIVDKVESADGTTRPGVLHITLQVPSTKPISSLRVSKSKLIACTS